MGRPRTWTDEDLTRAVRGARDWREVTRRLGINPGGKATRSIQGHAARLRLDVAHLPAPDQPARPRPPGPPPRTDPAREVLAPLAARALSWAHLLELAGSYGSARTYGWIKGLIATYEIDVSHFTAEGRRVAYRRVPERPKGLDC